jgi:hypothetical protein
MGAVTRVAAEAVERHIGPELARSGGSSWVLDPGLQKDRGRQLSSPPVLAIHREGYATFRNVLNLRIAPAVRVSSLHPISLGSGISGFY